MSNSIDPATLSKPEFVAHWFQRVWTEEDASAIDELMDPKAVVKGVANGDCIGPDDFRVFQQSLLAKIKDVKFTILHTMEDGDWVAALWSLTATGRSTGNPVNSTGTVFARISNGRLEAGYNHFDIVGMYQDIGLLPQDTLPRLFEGKALV